MASLQIHQLDQNEIQGVVLTAKPLVTESSHLINQLHILAIGLSHLIENVLTVALLTQSYEPINSRHWSNSCKNSSLNLSFSSWHFN